jgi:hypothetical protein
MPARRGVALVLALLGAACLAPGLPRWVAAEPASQLPDAAGAVGTPGPSAVGVPVDPHHLPAPDAAGMPVVDGEVPRRFPVDQQTFERMKEQANAEATAAATAEEVAP